MWTVKPHFSGHPIKCWHKGHLPGTDHVTTTRDWLAEAISQCCMLRRGQHWRCDWCVVDTRAVDALRQPITRSSNQSALSSHFSATTRLTPNRLHTTWHWHWRVVNSVSAAACSRASILWAWHRLSLRFFGTKIPFCSKTGQQLPGIRVGGII